MYLQASLGPSLTMLGSSPVLLPSYSAQTCCRQSQNALKAVR